MDAITHVFANGDYLPAAVATVASFVVGMVWYHPKVFGTAWMKGVGMTTEEASAGNMAAIFGTTAVASFLAALALSPYVSSVGGGLNFGLAVGVFWAATTHVKHALFEQRSAFTIAIGAAHDIVVFAVMGAVVGAL